MPENWTTDPIAISLIGIIGGGGILLATLLLHLMLT
jgi:hypothetical protein